MRCILQRCACCDVTRIDISAQLNQDLHSLNEATPCNESPTCQSAIPNQWTAPVTCEALISVESSISVLQGRAHLLQGVGVCFWHHLWHLQGSQTPSRSG